MSSGKDIEKPPRSRSPRNGDKKDEQEEVSELEAKMLAMWNKSIEPLMQDKHDAMVSGIQKMVSGLVSGEVNRIETKVVGLETKVDSGFEDVNKKFENVNLALERIEKHFSAPASSPRPQPQGSQGSGADSSHGGQSYASIVASSAPSPQSVANDVTTPSFNRKANPTKLFANLHGREKVSKAKFKEAINALAFEAGLKETEFEIVGDNLDDRFELQFLGDLRLSSVKTLQFFDSLKIGRGKWKPQFAKNDAGTPIQFYIAPDKNPCQIRKEILCKHLKGILVGLSPNAEFFVKKETGSIYSGSRVVVSVIITGPESARLDWCHAKRIELAIDQAEAESSFAQYVVTGRPGS